MHLRKGSKSRRREQRAAGNGPRLVVEPDFAQERASVLRAEMAGHQLHEFVLRRSLLRRAVRHHSRDGPQIRRQAHRRLIDEALFERRRAGASALSRGRAGLSRAWPCRRPSMR